MLPSGALRARVLVARVLPGAARGACLGAGCRAAVAAPARRRAVSGLVIPDRACFAGRLLECAADLVAVVSRRTNKASRRRRRCLRCAVPTSRALRALLARVPRVRVVLAFAAGRAGRGRSRGLAVPGGHAVHTVDAVLSPYVPAPQLTHADCPPSSKNVCTGHGRQSPAAPLAVETWKVPAWHSLQAVLPDALWYRPSGHAKQAASPDVAMYRPSAHPTHDAESSWLSLPRANPAGHTWQDAMASDSAYKPAAQTPHSTRSVPDSDVCHPAGQALHDAAASSSMYRPAVHARQDDLRSCAPVNVPATHALQSSCPASSWYLPSTQWVQDALSAAGLNPGWHALHRTKLLPPGAPSTVPAGQGAHAAFPRSAMYVPKPHGSHVTFAVSAWYVPTRHALHSEAPNVVQAWYLPAAHGSQLVALPVACWYLPASQGLHAALPASFWYVPASQSLHVVAPATANFPAVQSAQPDVPLRNVPASHEEHVVAPSSVSWWHAWHAVAPSTPLYLLASHAVQAASKELPPEAWPCLPAGQGAQSASCLPSSALNLPAPHMVQPDPPSSSLYWPALHAVQASEERAASWNPAGQRLHMLWPVVSAKVPGPHSVQKASCPSMLYLPAAHVLHAAATDPSSSMYKPPSAHVLHVACPASF